MYGFLLTGTTNKNTKSLNQCSGVNMAATSCQKQTSFGNIVLTVSCFSAGILYISKLLLPGLCMGCHEKRLRCHATAQTCSSTVDAILKPNICLKKTSKLLLQCQVVLTVWHNSCMDLKVFTCVVSQAPVWFPGLSLPTITCSADC